MKALEGSIEKWYKIWQGEGEDRGTDNCPLCKEFIEAFCKRCPVKKKTGRLYCHSTPYKEWCMHGDRVHKSSEKVQCDVCKGIARAEYEFLVSLREKENIMIEVVKESNTVTIDDVDSKLIFVFVNVGDLRLISYRSCNGYTHITSFKRQGIVNDLVYAELTNYLKQLDGRLYAFKSMKEALEMIMKEL